MVFPKARLVVSACLFVAWIGFLVYLVTRTHDPVILSRPQLKVASIVLVAEIEEQSPGLPAPTVTVKKVAWPKEEAKLAGTRLTVEGLADCGRDQGWRGAGEYIVPLTRTQRKGGPAHEVTPLPLSPGYEPKFVTVELEWVGPEKEKVAELAGKLLGGADKKNEITSGSRRHNVPRQEAEDIKRKLEAAGATVKLTEGEARIYRATKDALEQLEELKPQ